MKNLRRNFCTIILLILASTAESPAQFGSSGTIDARSMGMAKTYNSLSSGIYAIGVNPANLSNTGESSVEFSTLLPLPFFSFHSGTDFLSINQFNYYFGGVEGKARVLTDEDKANLNELFSNGGLVFANFTTTVFSIAINAGSHAGVFGISVNDFAGTNASIPKAIVDLGLNGNLSGKKYDFADQKLKSWWIRNYSLSYSREILDEPNEMISKILCGISVKLVHGFYFAGIEKINTTFETSSMNEIIGNADLVGYAAFADGFGVKYDFDSTEHSSNISPFMPPAGKGFGMDFGISASIGRNWNVSFALTDVGSIMWNKNTAEFFAKGSLYIDDLTNDDQLDSLKESLTGDSKKIENFSTGLPTALRVGASWFLDEETNFLPGTLLLGMDYNQGFNDLPGNSKSPRLSFGFEWKPADWIPYLRSGLSVGGADEFAWAVGLGLYTSAIEFDFATSYFQSIISPNSAKQISVAFGSRWRF